MTNEARRASGDHLSQLRERFRPKIREFAAELWSLPVAPEMRAQLALLSGGDLVAFVTSRYLGEHFTGELEKAARAAASLTKSAEEEERNEQ